jgi:2-methylcitrate dehydratase PrpD
MVSTAENLARWAQELRPTDDDLALAERALLDTMAVTLAARENPLRPVVEDLPDAARWSALGHVLDFDDLHLPSTAHISVVCVPATLAAGGDARAYLAGAGVMARLGATLGWSHYASGWHVTCTAGAPAAAAAASVALGQTPAQTAQAIALAVPAAGGVQRAFGSSGKSLQVGFAAEAGVRAARLVGAGADADPAALDQWLDLVAPAREIPVPDLSGPAVPDGLAIKIFPCCYALQRPIGACRLLLDDISHPDEILRIRVRTPECTVQPLIHHEPITGLQGKFSLEYAIAATLLDGWPGFASFETTAVTRDAAQDILDRVELTHSPGKGGLLAGQVELEITLHSGQMLGASLELPPGSPGRPPGDEELTGKFASCGEDVPGLLDGLDWSGAAKILDRQLPGGAQR